MCWPGALLGNRPAASCWVHQSRNAAALGSLAGRLPVCKEEPDWVGLGCGTSPWSSPQPPPLVLPGNAAAVSHPFRPQHPAPPHPRCGRSPFRKSHAFSRSPSHSPRCVSSGVPPAAWQTPLATHPLLFGGRIGHQGKYANSPLPVAAGADYRRLCVLRNPEGQTNRHIPFSVVLGQGRVSRTEDMVQDGVLV